MKSQIVTTNGVFEYEELEFARGNKKINRTISKKNLLDFRSVLEKEKLKFGLIYGTLLGAIRENDFIKHDEDIDLYMLFEDRDRFLDCLFKLKEQGFKVGRFYGELLSIVRDGEYIDIYFFKKNGFNYRKCEGSIIKAEFLENTKEYLFLGEKFNVAKDTEKLIVSIYGKDWRIPKENSVGTNWGIYLKIKFFIQKRSTTLFKIISWLKKKF